MAWIDVNMPDGSRYYSNLQTQQSTWTAPPGFAQYVFLIFFKIFVFYFVFYFNSINSDWYAMDDGSGNIYYMNHITNESSWEMPAAYKKAVFDGDIAETEYHKPLSPSSAKMKGGQFFTTWVEQKDDASGLPFYYNSKTGEVG